MTEAAFDDRSPGIDLATAGVVETMAQALVVVAQTGDISYVNPAAEALFGYPAGSMIGRPLDVIIPPRHRGAHAAGVMRVWSGSASRLEGRTIEVDVLRSDGTEVPVEFLLCIWDANGTRMMGALMRDISERRTREARLKHLADHDGLTGLPARSVIADCFDAALKSGAGTTLTLVSIPDLRRINESLGHASGDALLQAAAIRLVALAPPGSCVARLGGDLFGLLTERADPLDAAGIGAGILHELEIPFTLGGHVVSVSAAVGIALAPVHGESFGQVLENADLALQDSGRSSPRAARLFQPAMRNEMNGRRRLAGELQRAFENDELEVFFQPQVELATGRIAGAEALLRWRHPERGLVPPAMFIPALENHTLAYEVGARVLDRACAFANRVRTTTAHRQFRIAVNLFGAQVEDRNLVETVERHLVRNRLPADALELELTETVALSDADRILASLRSLAAIGVRLAFDDFGTGYASLSMLKDFPLSTIKIDKSFIRDMGASRRDEGLVRAILQIGRDFDLEVVAEGVETPAQASMLHALGCDFAQGFLYARPVPQEELFATLTQASPPRQVGIRKRAG